MNKINQHSGIKKVIDYMNKNPNIFSHRLKKVSITVVATNQRKRYTDFYRLKVQNDNYSNEVIGYYWVKIVKKKPTKIIHATLKKQLFIMSKLHLYLKDKKCGKLTLSCCEPVILLPELRTLITRECSGHLLNDYLKKTILILRKRTILDHCYNCGVWLRKFHECFMENKISSKEFEMRLERYKSQFGKKPESGLEYITNCHNDYSPRNIFVSKDSVEVIDYTDVSKGFPESDIKYFENYIMKARFNLLYPVKFKREMAGVFLEGYKSCGGLPVQEAIGSGRQRWCGAENMERSLEVGINQQ